MLDHQIVWHEVCHLEVMDHSPRFWALLARHCPDYREHVRWLRRHGQTARPLTRAVHRSAAPDRPLRAFVAAAP